MPWSRWFYLLDERSSFALLTFTIILILRQKHLTQPDSFDDTFGANTHFFALKGVTEKEDIIFLIFETIDLTQLRVDDVVIVPNNFMKIVASIVNILQLSIPGQKRLNTLLPLINTLNTMHSQYPQMIDPLLKHLVQLIHIQLLLLPLTHNLVYLLYTRLSRLYRWHYLLHQRCLLCYLWKLVLYVL